MKARTWLGLDLGATKLLAVARSEAGEVLATERCESLRDEGPEAVLSRALELLRTVGADSAVAGVGVGFAGLVETQAGRVSSSIMLPGWEGFPLSARVEAELGVACRLSNDATAAGWCEFDALGRPTDQVLVVITVGTGIGGSIFLDGRPFGGRDGHAGEFGNMSIEWRGQECWCGNRGCLNTLASGSAMSARAAELGREHPESALADLPSPPPLQRVNEAARAGDPLAKRVIEEGARALGAGVANALNLFNPDRVALAGGVVELGEEWLALVREEARARALGECFAGAEIVRACLGSASGAVGAALLAQDVQVLA